MKKKNYEVLVKINEELLFSAVRTCKFFVPDSGLQGKERRKALF